MKPMILSILTAFYAHHGNTSLVADQILYQKSHGRYCKDIKTSDVKSLKNYQPPAETDREKNPRLNQHRAEVAHGLVLKRALSIQIDRDQCFQKVTSLIKNDMQNNKTKNSWGNRLIKQHILIWMLNRKFRLVSDLCQKKIPEYYESLTMKPLTFHSTEDWRQVFNYNIEGTPNSPPLWKKFFPNQNEKEKWFNICSDEKTMETVRHLPTILPLGIAGISDERLLNFVGTQSRLIYDKESRKPISDKTILAGDLKETFRSLESPHDNDVLFDAFAKKFTNLYGEFMDERKKKILSLESLQNRLPANPSARRFANWQKDYLYDQKALDRALVELDQANKNFLTGETQPTTDIGVCVKAQYHQSFKGEMIEMAVGGLLGGAGAGLKVLSAGGKATRMARAKSVLGGSMLGQLPFDLKYILKTCRQRQTKGLTPDDQGQDSLTMSQHGIEATHLTKDMKPINITDRYNPIESLKATKDCSEDAKSFVLKSLDYSNCIYSMVEAALPLTLAAPLSLSGL